jgi:DNA-binding transcriptional ArsR family regulator
VEQALRAIANTRRRTMLELVWDRERTATEIAALSGLSKPAASQHLRVLREAGLLAERRDGTRRLYRARAEGLLDLREFLDQFWDDRLEDLRREAEREERTKRDDRGSQN